MWGEERRGEEGLPGALVCDSPQAPRPSLLALSRQAGRQMDPPKEALRGNLAPALHRVTHGSTELCRIFIV